MMWTPVLNNIVMIFTFGLFIWVYGTAADSQHERHDHPARRASGCWASAPCWAWPSRPWP